MASTGTSLRAVRLGQRLVDHAIQVRDERTVHNLKMTVGTDMKLREITGRTLLVEIEHTPKFRRVIAVYLSSFREIVSNHCQPDADHNVFHQ
jgi:hypothetical protein